MLGRISLSLSLSYKVKIRVKIFLYYEFIIVNCSFTNVPYYKSSFTVACLQVFVDDKDDNDDDEEDFFQRSKTLKDGTKMHKKKYPEELHQLKINYKINKTIDVNKRTKRILNSSENHAHKKSLRF